MPQDLQFVPAENLLIYQPGVSSQNFQPLSLYEGAIITLPNTDSTSDEELDFFVFNKDEFQFLAKNTPFFDPFLFSHPKKDKVKIDVIGQFLKDHFTLNKALIGPTIKAPDGLLPYIEMAPDAVSGILTPAVKGAWVNKNTEGLILNKQNYYSDFPIIEKNLWGDVNLDELDSCTRTSVIKEPQKRTPHIEFIPENPLLVEELFQLVVYANTEVFSENEIGQPVEITLPDGEDTAVIEVWLSVSEGLKIIEKDRKTIVLNRNELETTKAVFDVKWLVAKESRNPKTCIMAVFSYNGRPCGWVQKALQGLSVPLLTEVTDQGLQMPAPDAARPDMTVIVVCPNNNDKDFQVSVSYTAEDGSVDTITGPWNLPGSAETLIREAIAGLKNQLDISPAEHFKSTLSKLTEKNKAPLSILIASTEVNMPWELMMPPQEEDEPLPLGGLHIIGRWTHRDGRPSLISTKVSGGWVIAPNYALMLDKRKHLPFQEPEAELVMKTVRGKRLKPVNFDTLQSEIKKEPKPLIHFVGHGVTSGESTSQALVMDAGKKIASSQLKGMREFAHGLKAGRSFVFLNACDVGQPIPSLAGGAGGIAAVLLTLGACAVIAPLWNVNDELAHGIAKELYEALEKGPVLVPDFIRTIRSKAFSGETKGLDTFAAYCFYGDPFFTLSLADPVIAAVVPAPGSEA